MAGAKHWSTDKVAEWLRQNGFGKYEDLFCKEHEIDGEVLLLLNENDLRNPPLSLSVLGDIKRIMLRISQLRIENGIDMNSFSSYTDGQMLLRRDSSNPSLYLATAQGRSRFSHGSIHTNGATSPSETPPKARFIHEKRKTFISFVYVFIVLFITAFVMTEVHDRVPDMDK